MEQSSTIKNEDDIETIENNDEKTDVDIQENGYAKFFVLFDLPLFWSHVLKLICIKLRGFFQAV